MISVEKIINITETRKSTEKAMGRNLQSEFSSFPQIKKEASIISDYNNLRKLENSSSVQINSLYHALYDTQAHNLTRQFKYDTML